MGGPIAALAAAAFSTWAVRGRSSSVFAPSIYRGPRDGRAIALTFDDGPSPSTPAILELLNRHEARATFFQCGMHVRRLPAIAQEVIGAGHEIGNHTDTHPPLWFRSSAFIADEIARAQQCIGEAAGVNARWFRAPYGVRWVGLRDAQRRFGLTGAMWTAIGRDWTLPADAVLRRLERHAEPGAIFCLHDGRERATTPDISVTLDAVRELLPRLRDAGYKLCSLSELFRLDPLQ